jgi:hypothetical protein
MGTTPVKLVNATDSWVHEAAPTTAKGTTGALLYANNITAKRANSYLYFTLPFPRGVTVISAKLRMVQFTAFASTSATVYRCTQAWSATKVTWNTRPNVTGAVTISKTSPPHATVWEWDVTALLQSVSSGSPWYGFAITSAIATGNASLRWYSPQSTYLNYRPVLEVSWKENPQKPTELYPSNGRAVSLAKPVLRTNFVDLSGDTTMAGINVRIFDTEALAIANTAPTWDSGDVASSVPELDLNTTAYPGAAAASTKWWRVRVKDGSGLWSDWSNYTSFQMQTKGVLTITNPTAATVSDPSLPITWTFTGRTQKAYQVLVRKVEGTLKTITYDSGKITSTALNATLGDKAMPNNAATYEITVRIWDTIDRESIAGDPAYVEASRTVTYVYSATVAPTTGLTGTLDPLFPWMKLDWARSVLPDRWSIYRDGKIIWSGEGDDLFVSGTAYTYTDRLADPRTPHTWMVVAVVNGVGSASSQTVTNTITPITLSLAASDGTSPVLIFDYSKDMALAEEGGIFQPAGSAPPVLITQSEHGYQGHIKGRLSDATGLGGLSARQWRDRFNQLKKNNGNKLILNVIDMSIEVFIARATIVPVMPGPGLVWYEVEFDFYQTDWEEVL